MTAFGPCSLSNLGPGFDALGLCVTGPGDRVTVWKTDASGVTVEAPEAGDTTIPTDPQKNTAARAANAVLRASGAGHGIGLRIEKGIPLGSGIGGSAASAVAATWAANEVLGRPFARGELVGAVLEGEAATGSRHGDNVLPALLGGMVLVDPSDPTRYRSIALPMLPPLAVILPRVQVLTHEARAVLPEAVPHGDASAQAASLAFLLDALRACDWPEVGRALMTDRLAEPFRAPLVPVYADVREAALGAGALGFALSGSGPAMVALTASGETAQPVLDAMLDASRARGVEATGWLAEVDTHGARILTDSPEAS